jgi:broad specificity phosphatase PhoE
MTAILPNSVPTHINSKGLTSKVEELNKLNELPVTNESTQRTYLIRHGESTANVYFEVDGKKVRYVSGKSTDIPLTAKGSLQIRALAQKLATYFPEKTKLVIVSSTAKRTQLTAKILFDILSKTHSDITLEQEGYEGLDERHLGEWEGRIKDETYTAAEASWKQLSAAKKFFTPEVEGGESYHEVARRALPAMQEIVGKYKNATVLTATSFNTINALALQLSGEQQHLSEEMGTEMPNLNLGNGDLVLFETQKSFANIDVVSHIKHSKSE